MKNIAGNEAGSKEKKEKIWEIQGIDGLDGGMAESMLGKVMENFEKTMMRETKKFDEMKKEFEIRQDAIEKERNSQHVPAILRNEGLDLHNLWQRVNYLFLDQFSETEISRKVHMKVPTVEFYQMILAHGIGAWLSTLSRDHLNRINQQIYDETSQWISKLWRFKCSASLFHGKLYDGILSVCRVALASQFPKYQTEGYNALYSRPPVIYLNSAVDTSLVDFLKINLGLPSQCICLVPNNFELGGDESMDTIALEQLISADTSSGKMPLLICVYAGSSSTGSMDRLNDIHELCSINRIWLHIEGLRLSQLTLLHVPIKVNTISSKVKSMTLDVGSWLGIPSVPFITLVNTKVPESYMHTLGFGAGYFTHHRTTMNLFPLWLSLQLMGHDGIIKKLENQAKMNCTIVKRIREIENIKLLARLSQIPKTRPKSDDKSKITEISGMKNFMDTILNFLIDGYQIPFVIVFRYDSQVHVNAVEESSKMCNGSGNSQTEILIRKPRFVTAEHEESPTYLNSLNQWLADNLVVEYPQMNITLISLPLEGLCLRICVQENDICQDISDQMLEDFFESLNRHVAIMNATVNRRHIFREVVRTKPQLLYIELSAWAGLGCVLFIPELYRADLLNISLEEELNFNNANFVHFLSIPRHLREINKINKMLIDELRNDDEAFSFGLYHWTVPEELKEDNSEDPMPLICIRFGLITDTTLVEELVDLVIDKGETVETSTKNLEKLSQLVKEGIDKVTEELAKEHEERLRQDGVLRQVPYIDSIINWWYPSSKNHIKGRSLNLSSGEIQLTEDTYKYKMQLMAGPQSVFSFNKEASSKEGLES